MKDDLLGPATFPIGCKDGRVALVGPDDVVCQQQSAPTQAGCAHVAGIPAGATPRARKGGHSQSLLAAGPAEVFGRPLVTTAKDDPGSQTGHQLVGLALVVIQVVELGQRLGSGEDRDPSLSHQVDVADQGIETAEDGELFQDHADGDRQGTSG